MVVRNKDQRPGDYQEMQVAFRPSHADATYQAKYGIQARSGGGRASARETIGRVAAGAIAKQLLAKAHGTEVIAWVRRIHTIEAIGREGDSCGGVIECVVRRPPVGLGMPVFDKLEADLAKAVMSLPATKGFEIGSGFDALTMRGSEHNDLFNTDGTTKTNHSGGIQGGISNGMPISFRVAFKPVATLMQSQESITIQGEAIELEGKGRHDACVVPRAVPIVESMAAIVILDFYLRNKSIHL
jgi:chorismate synthase